MVPPETISVHYFLNAKCQVIAPLKSLEVLPFTFLVQWDQSFTFLHLLILVLVSIGYFQNGNLMCASETASAVA